ncbi:fimbrial protein [Providencia stuartii]|uniref:fimbrial protein n=1 Tax=Providencia stuartii TaxID=588 RepID=UPI0018C7FDC7|nr:fimbrial protein [Providencia stuartii]MBG5909123.1 fimbrial protein [Providencia stuartii]WAZ74185.1 fimbrial protein [Providencia stuartii]HAU5736612.1 hypothetical protein [Providencia stuartii]HAU5774767.1 hypothetical protein [Providencia stuartii]HEM6895663.1 fimbrial protein [Providencia stuartii]
MGKKTFKIFWLYSVLLGTVLLPRDVLAGSTQLDFRVTIRIEIKTCDVNDNQAIEVDFGDMIIKNIDGVAYEQPIDYTLDCDDATNSTPLKLRFENNSGANFNANLLRTSEPNLGLRVKQDGYPFAFNNWVYFTYGNQPELSVVPVARGSAGIDDGPFTASALLTVEYE